MSRFLLHQLTLPPPLLLLVCRFFFPLLSAAPLASSPSSLLPPHSNSTVLSHQRHHSTSPLAPLFPPRSAPLLASSTRRTLLLRPSQRLSDVSRRSSAASCLLSFLPLHSSNPSNNGSLFVACVSLSLNKHLPANTRRSPLPPCGTGDVDGWSEGAGDDVDAGGQVRRLFFPFDLARRRRRERR